MHLIYAISKNIKNPTTFYIGTTKLPLYKRLIVHRAASKKAAYPIHNFILSTGENVISGSRSLLTAFALPTSTNYRTSFMRFAKQN